MNTFCFLRFKSQILLNHQNKLKPQMIEVLALFRAPSEHDQQPQIFMYNTQLSESLDESSM